MRMNKKTIISLALCLGAIFMAVGYSILMTELKINGSASISSTWDVRITSIDERERTGSAYHIEEPSYTVSTAKFNVNLVNPGDYMVFTVVIENRGTIPAVLNGMSVSQSGTDAIIYTVRGLQDGDTLYPDDEVYLDITVQYNSDIIADPNDRVKKLKVDLDWVQYTEEYEIPIKNYKVVYKPNGGSGSMDEQTCFTDEVPSEYCVAEYNEFARSGYRFMGWSTTPDGPVVYYEGDELYLTNTNETTYLYAVWTDRLNANLDNVRYIKDCINGNSVNASNHWVGIEALQNGKDLALYATISETPGEIYSSVSAGKWETVIDGNIHDGYAVAVENTGNQCLTIDLGKEYDLDEITVWHYWNDNRVYYDNITYTAGNEQAWDIVMDEIIPESVNGKTVTAYNDDPVGYVESNLVVWYDGIQNTGTTRSSSTTTWKDLSGTGKNGTLYSGTSVNSNPTWGTNYLALDGDDWVSIAALNYENPTIEVVFSADTAKTTEMDLVVNYEAGGYGIQITNSQLIAVVNVGGTYYKLYEDVDINTKYYAALTYLTMSANVSYKQTLYFNGQNSGYNTLSGPIKSPDNNTIMTVGVNPVGSSPQASYFDGNIYAVRIYDRALTDEEIARNYQVDKARFGL